MSIKQFFKPDRRKIFLLFILLIIAYASIYIMFGFAEMEHPSALINVIMLIFQFLLFPLMYLFDSLVIIIDCSFGMLCPFCPFLGMIIKLIYFYIFSCLIIFIWDKIKKNKRIKKSQKFF